MNENDDPYQILGVSTDATDADIKKAYRKLALKFHPDKYAGLDPAEQSAAQDKFAKIAEANEILSDPEERWQYDMRKKNGSKPGTRYVRPTGSTTGFGPTTTTTYDGSGSHYPSQSTTRTTSSPNVPSSYKVTRTTYDENGVPTTSTYYTNEPPSQSTSSRTTTTLPRRNSTGYSAPKTTYCTGASKPQYKVTKTTYDEHGVPTTTTFYSDTPPSSAKTTTFSSPTTKKKPSVTPTTTLNPSSPYKVTRTTYDEHGNPQTSVYYTDSPPSSKSTGVTKPKVVSQKSTTPNVVTSKMSSMSLNQPMSMSSSNRVVKHPDGTTEVITTTKTTMADGSIQQKSSSQFFPKGVTIKLSGPN